MSLTRRQNQVDQGPAGVLLPRILPVGVRRHGRPDHIVNAAGLQKRKITVSMLPRSQSWNSTTVLVTMTAGLIYCFLVCQSLPRELLSNKDSELARSDCGRAATARGALCSAGKCSSSLLSPDGNSCHKPRLGTELGRLRSRLF